MNERRTRTLLALSLALLREAGAGAARAVFLATFLTIAAGGQQTAGHEAPQGHYEQAPEARYPKLSPSAAYDAVSQPVVLTRAAVSNWSDTEIAALAVATSEARLECATRSPEMFHGSDLIALGRLCALGQQWSSVANAAGLYINAPSVAASARPGGGSAETSATTAAATEKPELATAYALAVDASLQMHDAQTALHLCQAMLKAVPYATTSDAAINEALLYLQLAFLDDALELYAAREPYVLAGLRARPAPEGAGSAPVGVGVLYADGLRYAALEQLAGLPTGAAATVRDLDAALAESAPTPDDEVRIAEERRRYAMLGQPLPPIASSLSLYDVSETPRINTEFGASTVLLLFPRWCAQCVRMAEGLREVLLRTSEQNVHVYALLAEPTPAVAAPPTKETRHAGKTRGSQAAAAAAPADEVKKTIEERLRRTPTLVVPEATVDRFFADGFPYLIATDSKGIVRFMQAAPENALVAGGLMDQVTAQITKQWPAAAKSATGASPAQP